MDQQASPPGPNQFFNPMSSRAAIYFPRFHLHWCEANLAQGARRCRLMPYRPVPERWVQRLGGYRDAPGGKELASKYLEAGCEKLGLAHAPSPWECKVRWRLPSLGLCLDVVSHQVSGVRNYLVLAWREMPMNDLPETRRISSADDPSTQCSMAYLSRKVLKP